jgi:outer membrane immunogenic protein
MYKLRLKILGGALTSALALSSAHAADLYSAGLKDSPDFAANWAGFYLGAHGGGAWSNLDVTGARSFSNDGSGGFGGGTMGYSAQRGHWVWGGELDIGVAELGHTKTDGDVKSQLDHGVYGDITARLGYGWDRTLVYAKGGFAFYDGAATMSTPGEVSAKSNSFTGWTVGAGMEYRLTSTWSVKAEYLHFDLGDEQVFLPSTGRWDNSLSFDTVKFGVNYHVVDTQAPLK